MRPIKFRAWNTETKEMLVHDPYMSFHPFSICPNGACYKQGVLQPLILQQFTGLLDKNGKEIYEGDILNFTFFYYAETEHEFQKKGVVEFGKCAFYFLEGENVFPFIDLHFDSEADIEVIGNIYENPELLSN